MQPHRMISIRTAGLDDAALLADLGRQTFHETFAALNDPADMADYLDQAYTIAKLTAELSEPGSTYLLAVVSFQVVGFARVACAVPPACVTGPAPVRLAKLYVVADALGTGVGAALMNAGIGWARSFGHETLWLGVWEHNHRAIAFYRRWGFVPVGTEGFGLGTDDQTDLVMQRSLLV